MITLQHKSTGVRLSIDLGKVRVTKQADSPLVTQEVHRIAKGVADLEIIGYYTPLDLDGIVAKKLITYGFYVVSVGERDDRIID